MLTMTMEITSSIRVVPACLRMLFPWPLRRQDVAALSLHDQVPGANADGQVGSQVGLPEPVELVSDNRSEGDSGGCRARGGLSVRE